MNEEIREVVESSIIEELEQYEYRGDNGDYTPNEKEQTLMHDFAEGLFEKWKPLFNLAERYLSMDGWPEEITNKYDKGLGCETKYSQGYNKALRLCKLVHMKKVEGLRSMSGVGLNITLKTQGVGG